MEILSKNPEDNKKVVKVILEKLAKNNLNILLLKGELGSGKTTLTSQLVKGLNFNNRVSSPTFVIERIYSDPPRLSGQPSSPLAKASGDKQEGGFREVHHIDLYRLGSKEEVKDIGLLENIEDKSKLFIIEWPELVEDNLKDYLEIRIEKKGEKRIFHLSA